MERRSSHQSRGERRSRPERRSRFDEERSFEHSDHPKRSFSEVRFGRSRFERNGRDQRYQRYFGKSEGNKQEDNFSLGRSAVLR